MPNLPGHTDAMPTLFCFDCGMPNGIFIATSRAGDAGVFYLDEPRGLLNGRGEFVASFQDAPNFLRANFDVWFRIPTSGGCRCEHKKAAPKGGACSKHIRADDFDTDDSPGGQV